MLSPPQERRLSVHLILEQLMICCYGGKSLIVFLKCFEHLIATLLTIMILMKAEQNKELYCTDY